MRYLLLLSILLAPLAAADTTGKVYAGAASSASIGGGETAWVNTSNATGSNTGTYASAALSAGGITQSLRAITFDFSGIPSGSTVTQIDVYFYRNESGSGLVRNYWMQLIDGTGTRVGSNIGGTTSWPATAAESAAVTWNSAALSSAGIDLTDVQDPDFGVAIQGEEYDDASTSARIYYVAIDVTYTPPAGGGGGAGFLPFFSSVLGSIWRLVRC